MTHPNGMIGVSPWVIEVNTSPGLICRNVEGQRQLLADTFSLVGIHADGPPPASSLYVPTQDASSAGPAQSLDALSAPGFSWLDHERRHGGGFERIFPLAD